MLAAIVLCINNIITVIVSRCDGVERKTRHFYSWKERRGCERLKCIRGVKEKEFGVQSSIDADDWVVWINVVDRSQLLPMFMTQSWISLLYAAPALASASCSFIYVYFSVQWRARERVPSIKWFRTLRWAMDEERDEREKKMGGKKQNQTEQNRAERFRKP